MEAFQNLIPAFGKTSFIHLQGWGEPFTHPDFFKMLESAKSSGCAVGTTTNGSLLTSESIERLVSEKTDIIAFSLAGVDERNDSIRRGTSIKKVSQAIEEMQRLKAKYKSENPKIHIAYMLLRSGLEDLEKLPVFFGNLGVDQVVISSLSLVVRSELDEESFFTLESEEYSELRQRLLELRETSRKLGVDVFFHIVSPLTKNAICSENIEKAVFIGADGSASPCVMANIPANGENYSYLNKTKKRLNEIDFGNILDTALNDIWNQNEYKRFRKSFSKDYKDERCNRCLKLHIDNLSNLNT